MDGHGRVPTREFSPSRHPMAFPASGAVTARPTVTGAPAIPAPRPAAESTSGPAPAWSVPPPAWSGQVMVGFPAEGQRGPGGAGVGPPAGLGGYPGPGTPNTAGNRLVVVVAVVLIGMAMVSVMLAAGYTAMRPDGLSGPTRPMAAAPVPAARTAPVGGPRTAGTDPGEADSVGAAGVASREPGASPRVDRVYLTAMRQRPTFSASDDAELYGLGRSTCGQLDQGRTFMSVVTAGGGLGLQAEDMGYLTAVSVMAYCPRHRPMLEQLIGQPLPRF